MSLYRIPQNINQVKHNQTNSSPTANNDITQGYSNYSKWIDTSVNPLEAYMCLDNSIGAAKWIPITIDAEDLGDSALKNVGTGADEVAAGNHNHDGVYLKPTDVDDTPVDGITVRPISSNWAYDFKNSQDLECLRQQGISIVEKDLFYMRNHNTKFISNCEATENWADGDWNTSNSATHGDDTAHFLVGSQGISITTTSTTAKYIHYDFTDLVLSKFEDLADSSTNDFIEFSIYCLTASITHLNNATIYFMCDTIGTLTNYFSFSFKNSIVNGWSHFKIVKNTFSATGSPDWSDVKGIQFAISSDDGTSVNYTIDAIRMTRKDTIGNYPNPLQVESNGIMQRMLEINGGTIFLGYDNDDLVIKSFAITVLKHNLTFDNVFIKMTTIANGYLSSRVYYGGGSNKVYMTLDDNISIYDYYNSTNIQKAFPINKNDEVETCIRVDGKSVSFSASKTGQQTSLSKQTSHYIGGETIQMTLWVGASIKSFAASSIPLMLK